MKRTILSLTLAALLLASAGCSAASASLTNAMDLQKIEVPAPDAVATAALSDFSERLFEQARGGGGENIVLSPLSAYFALSMTAAGARDSTAAAFTDMLGLDAQRANETCLHLLRQLMEASGGTKLTLANSLWADDQLTVEDDFLRTARNYYDADVFQSDLQNGRTVDDVNAWISGKTEKLIPKMLEKIDERSVLLLINALYLNATWRDAFDPNDTMARTFTCGDGKEIPTDFLCSRENTRSVIQTDEVEGIVYPYDDGKLAFMAVKPLSGKLSGVTLDGSTLATWLSAAQEREHVIFNMPKFSHSYDIELNGALTAMGLGIAFDQESADFSGLGVADAGNIYIGRALQKVVMRVHEKGTEAAAATVVLMEAGGIIDQPEPYFMNFDSPFLYAVIDLTTGIPLFLGAFDRPVAE